MPGQFSAPGIPSLSSFHHRRSRRSGVQQAGGGDGRGDGVRVAVGGGPAVLEVALPLLAHLARDADAGAAVGHAGRELVDAGGLQVAQQAALVVLAAAGVVHGDVLGVSLAQLLDGSLNVPGGEEPGGQTQQRRNLTSHRLPMLEFKNCKVSLRASSCCCRTALNNNILSRSFHFNSMFCSAGSQELEVHFNLTFIWKKYFSIVFFNLKLLLCIIMITHCICGSQQEAGWMFSACGAGLTVQLLKDLMLVTGVQFALLKPYSG